LVHWGGVSRGRGRGGIEEGREEIGREKRKDREGDSEI